MKPAIISVIKAADHHETSNQSLQIIITAMKPATALLQPYRNHETSNARP